jgi:hypothetical protein
LLMVCRGDLSDIGGPSSRALVGPVLRLYPLGGELVGSSRRHLGGVSSKELEIQAVRLSQPYAADRTEQPLTPGTQVTTFSWDHLEHLV